MIAAPPDERLVRAIGPWALGANALNLTLGAGIFALPAAVAGILGPAAILAYLVCGLAMMLVLACFAELGSRTLRSGGAVAYIEDAFGPGAGFVAWAVFTIGYCAGSDAAIANVLVDAMGSAAPALAGGLARPIALVAVFGGLAAVNIRGVRQGTRVAVATTIAKTLPLLVVVAAGAAAMRWEALRWTAWPAPAKVGEASLLLFFAFSGAESTLTPGGEIRDPVRTVPRGLLGGAAAVVLIYVAIQLVSQGVLGTDITGHGAAPLAAVAGRVLGPAGWSLVLACTALAVFGTLSGDMLASPRAFLPIARQGMIPEWLGAVHPRFHTPHLAIAAYAGLSCLFAVTGAFRPLAILASVALLLVYLVVCLAVLRLRRAGPAPPGGFRTPGGPLVPLLGTAVVAWLLAHSSRTEMAATVVSLALAGGYYAVRRRGRAPRSGTAG